MSDKCGCQVCEGFDLETMESVIIAHLEAILAARSNVETKDAFYSLFSSAYMLGYKTALIEGIERNLETLDYMTNGK